MGTFLRQNARRIPTLIVLLVVVFAGGIVTIFHPESLSYREYVAVVGVAAGLLGIGYGRDGDSRP